MEHLQAYNKKLLSNILPVHVAEYFMSGDKNNDVRQKFIILPESITQKKIYLYNIHDHQFFSLYQIQSKKTKSTLS